MVVHICQFDCCVDISSLVGRFKMCDASVAATEIRCEEKSKGGLKYDVILADPAGTPPAPKRQQSPTRTKSIENIEEKMKAAEERRLVSFGLNIIIDFLDQLQKSILPWDLGKVFLAYIGQRVYEE